MAKSETIDINVLMEIKKTYHDALVRLLDIVDDICGEECCSYNYGDEIEEIRMIAENEKPCRYCHNSGNCDYNNINKMCELHQVFCKPGYFPECRIETTLFTTEPRKEST